MNIRKNILFCIVILLKYQDTVFNSTCWSTYKISIRCYYKWVHHWRSLSRDCQSVSSPARSCSSGASFIIGWMGVAICHYRSKKSGTKYLSNYKSHLYIYLSNKEVIDIIQNIETINFWTVGISVVACAFIYSLKTLNHTEWYHKKLAIPLPVELMVVSFLI